MSKTELKGDELSKEQLKEVVGGATGIEYGLIAAGISVAIIKTVNSLGTKLSTTFGTVQTKLS